ncbi:MAG: hypothetical protein AAGI88_11115 [Pseudomonadota bacterium]
MSSLPGLLVEYLISGLVTLLWVYPLIPESVLASESAILFVPLVYVLGMATDFVAYWVTLLPKIGIRELSNRRRETVRLPTSRRKANILFHSSSLWDEVEKRSSRDRIARGTALNVVPIGIVLEMPTWLTSGSFLLFAAIWAWFEYQSYNFELSALAIIDEDDERARSNPLSEERG